MNAETLKDFLISLGFDVDDVGARKFETVVAGVTANVLKLGTVVEAAAGTVLLFTTKIAAGLDDLYWASQRTLTLREVITTQTQVITGAAKENMTQGVNTSATQNTGVKTPKAVNQSILSSLFGG